LWSFNEELVARAIYRSSIPIVTGIGHETDLTIADLCADLQTHTPTASAEAVIPDTQPLFEFITNCRRNLIAEIIQYISDKEEFIQQHRRIIGNLDLYISNHNLQIDYRVSSLINAFNGQLSNISRDIKSLRDKLHNQAPLTKIFLQEKCIEHMRANIQQRMLILLERKQSLLGKQAALMESASPLSILARGYSVVSKTDKISGEKNIITNSNQVAKGDLVEVRLSAGELMCQVKMKKNDN
jgi:exodeoxyribonuclease VII large subunit